MSDAFHTPNTVDPRLLEVLVCPVTRGPLTYDRDANELVSKGAKLVCGGKADSTLMPATLLDHVTAEMRSARQL